MDWAVRESVLAFEIGLLLSEGRRFGQLGLCTITHLPAMVRWSLEKDFLEVISPLLGVELV